METIDTEIKTANQLYKESGSELPFKDFIQQIKDQSILVKNEALNSIIKDSSGSGYSIQKTTTNKNSIGLSKTVLIASVLIIITAIGFNYYQKNK